LIVSLLSIDAGLPPISQELIDIISKKNITASATPTQIHVSYLGKTDYMVQWVSAATSDPSSVIYGVTSDDLNIMANGSAVAYSFEGYTSGGIHNAVLPTLKTDTLYYYQVGGAGQYSTTFNFKTAPEEGKAGVKFGIIGDVGADPNSEETIKGLINIRKNIGLDLVLHAGDLSYANNYNPGGPVWDHYGEIMQPLLAYTPYEPSVGNHEEIDKFTGFRLRYGTAILEKNSVGGDFFWSVNWGNVHIVMLSSESDYSATSPQIKWLQSDLAAVDRTVTPWVIALWHRPWYCSNHAHQGEGEQMRLTIEPVLNQHSVDIVFNGHVHAYERVTEMYNFVPTPGKTSYFVCGNGGTPEGLAGTWLSKPDWSLFRVAQWGYGLLNVANSTHAHFAMYSDTNGSLLDETWVYKKYPRG
jgi:hypothetical protein